MSPEIAQMRVAVVLANHFEKVMGLVFEAHKTTPGPHDRTNGRRQRKKVSPSWRRMARQARRSYAVFHHLGHLARE